MGDVPLPPVEAPANRERVVYLFGAGASDACAKVAGSARGTLMRDLAVDLAEELRTFVTGAPTENKSLEALVNDVMDEETDIEHVITFLDESPSQQHREFAAVVRTRFAKVLRERLQQIRADLGDTPDSLYYALLDMHEVTGFGEELRGFLTLNYDDYLEHAIDRSTSHLLDQGVSIRPRPAGGATTRVLKLHGSFGWDDACPITTTGSGGLWIPPGIQKAKERYPFNVLWGLARELLDCDVLRIIGCRLGPNDWDLISLLFTTRHTSSTGWRYRIEVIDAPERAFYISRAFPYLGVQSLLEIDSIGSQLVSELIGGHPRSYRTLSPDAQKEVVSKAGTDRNWFFLWLKLKAETVYRDLGRVDTPKGALKKLMEAH